MIQLHVITRNTEQIKNIAELLITKKLITGATVIDSKSMYESSNGKIESVSTNLLIGRTRAMLFSAIEKLLKDKYQEEAPAIYGMPIVSMDLKHREKLKKVVKEI